MLSTRLIFLLSLAVAVWAPISRAQSSGTFTAAGSMNTPRAGHSATLLLTGSVLIAGGSPGAFADPLATAELYDHATHTFTATGSMTTPRFGHSATLLSDGRALITGGGYRGEALASAELYDPSTGAFTPTGAMNALRGTHAATLLRDGRVLVTGCAIPCNSAIAEVYDPVTGRFANVGSPDAGSGPATLLTDDQVLITGGCLEPGVVGAKAQVFDPHTATFHSTGLMTTGCGDIHTATLLPNGKVLFAGNAENNGSPADAELYDPAAGKFVGLGLTLGPHEFSTATLLADGNVLIAGGQLPGGNGNPGAELYTPPAGGFSLTASMNTRRHFHTATLLPDSTVLIAGGYSVWPGATAASEVYRPGLLIPAPALLFVSGAERGQGAILHAGTSRIASSSDPAAGGEYLEVFLTGLSEGTVIPPRISIGDRAAEITWFGKAPGFADLNQVNVRVPTGITPGGRVPVRLTYLNRHSNEVSIGVR
jgi:hypothetical protein